MPAAKAAAGRLAAAVDHLAHDRVDVVVEAPAAEHAVMSSPRLNIVRAQVGPQVLAQIVCGERLPERADVIAFAFHREQCGAPDGPRIDRPAAPRERTLCERILLENEPNRL